MTLLSQTYGAVWAIVLLSLLLGVVAICIPRIRRKDLPDPNDQKKKQKKQKLQ